MSPTAGVVSGNDLWLCPFGKSLNPLPIDDPVYMNCAKIQLRIIFMQYVIPLIIIKL